MKLTRYICLMALSFSLVWGHALKKAADVPAFKSNSIKNIEISARSVDSRTDTITIFLDDMEGGTTDWTFGPGWEETSSSYSSPSTSQIGRA